jgi:hypothetical protein
MIHDQQDYCDSYQRYQFGGRQRDKQGIHAKNEVIQQRTNEQDYKGVHFHKRPGAPIRNPAACIGHAAPIKLITLAAYGNKDRTSAAALGR